MHYIRNTRHLVGANTSGLIQLPRAISRQPFSHDHPREKLIRAFISWLEMVTWTAPRRCSLHLRKQSRICG